MGEEHFRLFGAQPINSVEVVGQLAYVWFDDSCRGQIVDLRSGRPLTRSELKVICDRSLLRSTGE